MAIQTYRTASGKSISQTLSDYGEKAATALGSGLYHEAQGIMAASLPLVPVDTAALRSSGFVAEPVRQGDAVTVELGYGGPAAKINPKTGESTDGYALFVHENLEAHHPVGQAKYLEVPFNAVVSGMDERLGNFVRSQMHGGIAEFGDPEV